MPRTLWLALLVAFVSLGCADDAASGDTAPIADGAPVADATPPDSFVGNDVIRPDLYAQPVPELGDVTLYVNLGDSIAAGWGVSFGSSYRELLQHNDDATYPDLAGLDLETRYPGIITVSKAVAGATSDEILGQAQQVPRNIDGDTVVTISVGGNDLLNDYQALLSATKTKELAALVKANLLEVKNYFSDTRRYPGKTTIAIFNVYDPTDDTGTIPLGAQVVTICEVLKSMGPVIGQQVLDNFEIFNAELTDFAETEGLLLVDMHTGFLGHGFNYDQPQTPYYDGADPTLWFQQDCIHPNKLGHHHLREMIWYVLFGE